MASRDLRRASTEIPGEDELAVQAADRRRFLTRAAAGGAIAFGAASIPLTALIPAAGAQPTGSTPGSAPAKAAKKVDPKVTGTDLTAVVFAQTVELAAVESYTAMIASARFTPAYIQHARDYQTHHQEHAHALAEWAGSEASNVANKTLLAEMTPLIDSATTQADMAAVAYGLEEGMAATYQFLLGTIEDWETAGVMATIEPVEGQHAIVWSQVSQSDVDAWAAKITTWIPNFQGTSDALLQSAYPAS